MLAWRSPNQVGEYVVLRPTADSVIPAWKTANGDEASFPAGDSRRLPARIDHGEVEYLGLVDVNRAGSFAATGVLGGERAYTVEAMDTALGQALANRGALGMYCNSLMVNKALFGRLPDTPPAPLEDIIDGAVKTGADLSGVVAWNYENSRQILEARVPVPALLHQRLSVDYADGERRPPPPRASEDHWLDGLERGVRTHIQEMIQRRDELAARAMPPAAMRGRRQTADGRPRTVDDRPQTADGGPQTVDGGQHGWPVTQSALPSAGTEDKLEGAEAAVEDYLAQFPAERRGAIVRGALVSVYMRETRTGGKPVSDAAVWLSGAKNERGERAGGVGHLTAQALRDIGLLDDIAETEEGLPVYPNAVPEQGHAKTIGINGVWFNWYQEEAKGQGLPVPAEMREVPRAARRRAKARVAEMARREWQALALEIREEAGRKVAYTVEGQRLGTVSAESAGRVEAGQVVRVRPVVVADGNVRGLLV